MFEFVNQYHLWFFVAFVLLLSGCAVHYAMHPGALNKADSVAYDALLVAEAAIDQARTEYADKQLPPATKDALNTLIQSYNLARDAWLMYRGALATNVPADAYFTQLNKNLSDLTDAVRKFEEAK